MRNRSALLIVMMFIAMQTVACGSQWKVLSEAKPNPFTKTTTFAAGGAYYRGLKVGGMDENDYVEKLNNDQKAKWKSDKTFFKSDFRKTLRREASGLTIKARNVPNAFLVKPRVIEIVPGEGKKNLKVKMNLRIERRNSTYDIVEITVEVKPSEAPTFSRRFRLAASKAAAIAAKYLKQRAK